MQATAFSLMGIWKIAQKIVSVVSEVGSLLWFLVLLGIIPEPLFRGADFLQIYRAYFTLLTLAIFGLSSFWIGCQFYPWLAKRRGLIEFPVAWSLSGKVQPKPRYGSMDMDGSDTTSKLYVKQHRHNLELRGKMKRLRPSRKYAVYLAKAYTPSSVVPMPQSDIIPHPYKMFDTDEHGNGEWDFPANIIALSLQTDVAILDRLSVLINDEPKNTTVLISDTFTVRV